LKVKELPPDDRPREKLLLHGAQSLSDAELIAILLRTGTKGVSVIEVARNLLLRNENLAVLATKSIGHIKKESGIGNDKAATLVASFEIGRRIDQDKKTRFNKKITSPQDIAEFFIHLLRDEYKEHFIVVCLNSNNKIIKYEVISVGSLSSSIVHPREVFKVAIDNNSANIILVHNHPSGNPEPSPEDIAITKKLVEAGKLLEIKVFDHIIVAGKKYNSFVEKRLI